MVNSMREEGHENHAIVRPSVYIKEDIHDFHYVISTWSVTASILRWGESYHSKDGIYSAARMRVTFSFIMLFGI